MLKIYSILNKIYTSLNIIRHINYLIKFYKTNQDYILKKASVYVFKNCFLGIGKKLMIFKFS